MDHAGLIFVDFLELQKSNDNIEDKDKQIREVTSELIGLKENERMKARVERRAGHFDLSETGKL